MKSSVNQLTRFGYVQKEDEYSRPTDLKDRQAASSDAFAVADGYMQEVLLYLRAHPEIFTEYTQKGRVRSRRTRFTVLGD